MVTPTEKKKAGPEKRMVYKYSHVWKTFANLASSYSVKEVLELLVVCGVS